MGPKPMRYQATRYAKGFVARDILQRARHLEHALEIARTPHLGGHNYQFFDFRQRKVVALEVAQGGRVHFQGLF